jgi:hypothetical protein
MVRERTKERESTNKTNVSHFTARSANGQGWDRYRAMCGAPITGFLTGKRGKCVCVVCMDLWINTGGYL